MKETLTEPSFGDERVINPGGRGEWGRVWKECRSSLLVLYKKRLEGEPG